MKAEAMNVHPIQYGPPLRTIAELYFPGAASSLRDADGATSHPLSHGRIADGHAARHFQMFNHARAQHRRLAPTDARPGDVVWFRGFNLEQQRNVQPIEFRSRVSFVLDEPCREFGPNAWYAWLASPFTAYAGNWDAFVPWDDAAWPYDPEAGVVHANRRTVVHVDLADAVTTRLAPAFLAAVQALSEEFQSAVVKAEAQPSMSELDALGFRRTLGGLRARTGPAIGPTDELRLMFSQLTLAIATEVLEFAQAWAAVVQAEEAKQPFQSLLAKLAARAGAVLSLPPIPGGFDKLVPAYAGLGGLRRLDGHARSFFLDTKLRQVPAEQGTVEIKLVQAVQEMRVPHDEAFALFTSAWLRSSPGFPLKIGLSLNGDLPSEAAWAELVPRKSVTLQREVRASDEVAYVVVRSDQP